MEKAVLDIELSNICQANCLMCPRYAIASRGLGIMQPETFKRIIESFAGIEVVFIFSGLGESLLNENIFDYLKLVKKKLPMVKTSLLTNGALLTKENMIKLMDSGLDNIVINIQSVDPRTYSLLTPGIEYGRVMRNVQQAIKIASVWKKINIKCVINEINKTEIDSFAAYWQKYGNVDLIFQQIHSRAGYVNNPLIISTPDHGITKRCKIFTTNYFIAWDGKVLACCQDVEGKHVIGDIHVDTFKTLRERKLKIAEKNEYMDICAKCRDF